MEKLTAASLLADSVSLGPHWVYNQGKLKRIYPEGIYELTPPASNHHPNKAAGDYTHYGDQTVILQWSVKNRDGFSPDGWRKDWVREMKKYGGYVDSATRETLESEGEYPSKSNDLAGASRIGPILDLELPLENAILAVRQQTGLTHGDEGVIDSAEFFTRAVYEIKAGASIEVAFKTAANEGSYTALDAEKHLETALLAGEDYFKESSGMGLTCHLPEAFPLTLYFALRMQGNLKVALSENGLAGGDTSARAMIIAMLYAAQSDSILPEYSIQGDKQEAGLKSGSNNLKIDGPLGSLSGVLEMPEGEPVAYALFAHCFTCGKDFLPEKRITKALAKRGIATLRIDFSGLGKSEGLFKDTSFVTNLDDLLAAASWMDKHFQAPQILIGHSLGGAAVLSAASDISAVKGVVTIGAPADPGHVSHLFEKHVDEIRSEGEAEVDLAGRKFTIGDKFLKDLDTYNHSEKLSDLRKVDVLILHSPQDATVPLKNAGLIYSALKHPKSFVSLDGADHLLTNAKDAEFVANLIEVWGRRVTES